MGPEPNEYSSVKAFLRAPYVIAALPPGKYRAWAIVGENGKVAEQTVVVTVGTVTRVDLHRLP